MASRKPLRYKFPCPSCKGVSVITHDLPKQILENARLERDLFWQVPFEQAVQFMNGEFHKVCPTCKGQGNLHGEIHV